MSFEFSGQTAAVAVFVDGDNLPHAHADAILETAERLGPVTLRRVYGDMAKGRGWGSDPRFASQHATSDGGRNCADIRLVIDAMEHALAGRARVFVIGSNDRDFGPLAVRLAELGHRVVGVGGAQASRVFQAGCSEFIRVEEAQGVQLDELDRLVCQKIVSYGVAGRIPLALLGSKLGQHGKARAHGAATWRGVLSARADRFVLEGAAATTVVRLHPAVAAVR